MTLLYASWMTRNQAADTTPEVYAQDTCDHVNRLYLYIYTRGKDDCDGMLNQTVEKRN